MKYKLLRYWLLLLIMITGGSVALQATDYVPVTSTSQLQAGKKYLFVGKYKTNKMESPTWATVKDYNSGSKVFNSVEMTPTEDDNAVGVKFTDPADAMTFTLGGEDGAWTFLGSDGKYMNLTNTSNQVHQADAVSTDNQKWTVAIDGSAVATIKNKALTARIFWSNINSTRFACYSNTQTSNTFYLYVEAGGGETPTMNYYVVGSMTSWGPNAEYKMTLNEAAEAGIEEYMIDLSLKAGDQFKVAKSDGSTIEDANWYPTGMGNNYQVAADGDYTVYFRPNADGGDDWHYKYIYVAAKAAPAPVFRDIKADLTQLQALATGSNVYIKVSETGEISQAASAEEANATLKGNWHSSNYGWSNFTASVPVQGCAKITYATHDYGNDIVVTNTAGDEVAKFSTKGPKWENDKVNNVVVAYYRTNEATTLNFSNANYNPYFAVEAIDPGDLPAEVTKYNITFAAGEGAGNAPAALEIEDGQTFKAPKNYFLYAEGKTLTGWNDGTTTYAVGDVITPAADMTLTAQFTANTVALADRTAPVTISYDLSGYNDVGTYNYQGNSGIMVTQATVNGQSIDVKADVDATSGKFAYNGSGWHQVNNGTKVTVPSCKGAQFEVATYSKPGAVYFNGSAEGVVTTENNSATYTATGEAASIEISQNDNDYWQLISIILPVTGGGGESTTFQDFEITNEQLSGAFDASTLPAGVTFSGTERNDNHGYGNVTLTVPVTGKVTFTIGGCRYANPATCKITNAAGELLAEPVLKTDKCYHETGEPIETRTATYVYKGEPTTLTFSNIAYLPYFKAEGEKAHEKITLDNEPASATFPFNEGTEGQKATFSNADYFLNSKVIIGSNWFVKDKTTYAGTEETRLEPLAQHEAADLTDADAVVFSFAPLPGLVFTPTKVSFKANRFGTDNGRIDAYWLNADGTTVELEKEITPERNNTEKNTVCEYALTGATPGEGSCGLKLFLYHLQSAKQIGLADIFIEGTLTGTEKDVPVLASFKINGNQYDVEDVFGDNYEATLELPKAEAMVSESNPLTDVTAKTGEIGTIAYAPAENACVVTIPMTAGETKMDYVLNVVFKPDFTLSYLDTEGNVVGTQLVEKDAAIGAFAYDINDVAATKDGYKARGWFKTGVLGEKFTTADVITADTKLYAIQTPIEVVSTHNKYFFDLTSKTFYAEDHEAFVPSGDKFYWHDGQHGWAFSGKNKIDLFVGPKAIISVTLCRYGSADDITITEGETQIGTLPGKNNEDVDAQVVAFNYEGAGGTISLNLSTTGEMYIHAVKVVNVAEVNYDSDGQWYFVKAGDANSFMDVLDVVNGKNAAADAERAFIFLPNGTYDLDATVKTAISGKNISIIGESMDKTIITTKPDKSIEGLGSADMFQASTTDLYLQDLTLKNALDYYNAGSAGRAAVLQDAGTRTIGKNIRMLSYQDTYYSSNAGQQAYWENCDIHGTVDFICGGGDIRFQNTTITLEKRALDGKGGRTITAPTTNTDFGYVFDGCTVVDLSEGKGDWNFGRTWQNTPICVYLNTTLDDVAKATLVSSRWTQKGMNNKDPKVFGEFGTKDAAGTDITPASNTITSFGGTFETILSAEQAADFTYEKMFAGWLPADFTRQLEAPIAEYKDGVVTITPADNGAIAYLIEKNGEFAGITTAFTFAIEANAETDMLTIRAANSRGGFGEAKQVAGTGTSVKAVNAAIERGEQVIYNLAGQRVNKATKGLYIINGKKVIIK